MRCHDCVSKNRPIRKNPVAHFCDACGFAMTADGRVIGRTSSALAAVAIAEASKEPPRGGFDDYYSDGGVRLTKQGAENMQRDVMRKVSDLIR